jgi:GT2 family glycosyltransferase
VGGVTAKVCAITVAFNNPAELSHLLCSLPGKTSLSGLIIVDNSEARYIKDNQSVFQERSQGYTFARYIEVGRNIGSAGGFALGMKTAHGQAFDWIWLLDQDGTVENECLAVLLQYAHQADILCPKVVEIHNPHRELSYLRGIQNVWGRIVPVCSQATNQSIDFFASHGTLVSRKVLDRVGYYDSDNFFVRGEDFDYSFRATTIGMTLLLVVDAEVRHPDFLHTVGKRCGGDKVDDRLPQALGSICNQLTYEHNCTPKGSSLEVLSNAYLSTKRLNMPQFWAALSFSLIFVSLQKIIGRSFSWKKTLRMYRFCAASKLQTKWPFSSVQEFCQYVCR